MFSKFINFFKKTIYTKEVFKFYKVRGKFVFLIIFLFSLIIGGLSYANYAFQHPSQILAPFPRVEEGFFEILNNPQDVNCVIENDKLNCDENERYNFETDKISIPHPRTNTTREVMYSVYINIEDDKFNDESFTPSFDKSDNKKNNFIVFHRDFFTLRYVDYNFSQEDIKIYQRAFNYENIDYFSFNEKQEEIRNIDNELLNEKKEQSLFITYDLMRDFHLTQAPDAFLLHFSNFALNFFFITIIASFILKGDFLFAKNPPLKFNETFKIAVYISIIPFVLAAIFGSLLFSDNIIFVFIFLFSARIVYIYARYLFNKDSLFYDYLKQIKR